MNKLLCFAVIAAVAAGSFGLREIKAGDGDRIRLVSRMANVGANVGAEGKARWERRDDGPNQAGR